MTGTNQSQEFSRIKNFDIRLPTQWPTLLSLEGTCVSNPSLRWRLGSRFVVPTVGLLSKFWMQIANNSVVHNAAVLYEALNQNYLASRANSRWIFRDPDAVRRPLITYSNHSSCLDDPLMWGSLIPFKWQFNSDRHRWSGAAEEVCFSKNWHKLFFALGKTFPIIRGEGIYQPAMDYAIKLMRAGQWLHFFPEGKVIPKPENCDPELIQFRFDENGKPVDLKKLNNPEDTSFFASKVNACERMIQDYSLKWGIARLIIEHVLGEGLNNDEHYIEYNQTKSRITEQTSVDSDLDELISHDKTVLPEVDILPIYHVGLDDVLPTIKPYRPKLFQKITFLIREDGPIRIDKEFLMKLFGNNSEALSLTEKRIRVMEFLESELNTLKEKAHKLHRDWINSSN